MKKEDLLKYGEQINKEICNHCGNVCKLNGYNPCMEKQALNEMLKFVKDNMKEEE